MKNLSNSAKDAQSKAVVLCSVKDTQEKNLTSGVVIVPTDALKSKEVQPKEPQTQQKEMPISIEKLADKAERLYLLKQKYHEIKEKRKQVDNFAISHDNNNAQLTLVDANGMSIKTSNPVSIKKLLDDWVIDLDLFLSKVEADMRKELAEA